MYMPISINKFLLRVRMYVHLYLHTHTTLQRSVALFRGLMELVSEVTTDEEKWARILYHLRHTLWPNGVLDVAKGKQVSYPEQRLLREGAAKEFKRFLPGECLCFKHTDVHTTYKTSWSTTVSRTSIL